jgi:hypothetical protein
VVAERGALVGRGGGEVEGGWRRGRAGGEEGGRRRYVEKEEEEVVEKELRKLGVYVEEGTETRMQYMLQLCRGHLFLDTPSFNAHTTAVDALWVGLPLITTPLERMASRVSASLLAAAGLTLFITRDLQDYRALAAALLHRPAQLRLARRLTVANGRGMGDGGGGEGEAGGRVFDVAAWVLRFECALRLSWEVFLNGGAAKERGGGEGGGKSGVPRFLHAVVSSRFVVERRGGMERTGE